MTGKTVIVTGANSGIGQAAARDLPEIGDIVTAIEPRHRFLLTNSSRRDDRIARNVSKATS